MSQLLKLVLVATLESAVAAMVATFVCLNALWFSNGTYGQGIDTLAPYGLVGFGALALIAKAVDFTVTMWLLNKRGKRYDNVKAKFYDALTARDFHGCTFWLEKMDECMYAVTRVLSTMEKWNGVNKNVVNSQYWQAIDGVSTARRLRSEVRQSEWK